MVVIPSLNCRDTQCVHEKSRIVSGIDAPWVHIDVADGEFAPVVLAEDAGAVMRILEEAHYQGYVEVHLMVARPETRIRAWLERGVKRIIVHAEALPGPDALEILKSECEIFDAELGVAVHAKTLEHVVEPFLGKASFWTILSVPIGFSGGIFQKEESLRMLSFLRARAPKTVIEIDGGMREDTGLCVKNAGADIIVSGSFIFSHEDPKRAFHILENL